MDFHWTKDQETLRSKAVDFAQQNLNKNLIKLDQDSAFSRESWLECAKFGLHGATIPKQYGGLGLSFLSAAAVLDGVGYGCRDNGLLFSTSAQLSSCTAPLFHFGTEKQKTTYLPRLCDGSLLGANGMTETGSGSDAFGLQTTAHKSGDFYILNGTKTFITNGPVADVVLIFARMSDSGTLDKISCFVVEKSTPGFSASGNIPKMGMRTAPFGEIVLKDCKVPSAQILGGAGQGEIIFKTAMVEERILIMATHVGAMERQLENSVQHAKDRKQFKKSIFDFQSVSNMLADMKVRLDSAKLLLYRAAWAKESGKNALLESSVAKLHISESWVQNNLSDLRIHGGNGYTVEYEIERQLRDSIGSLFYSGTSEIQRNLISALMS